MALAATASSLAAPKAVHSDTVWSPTWKELIGLPVIALVDFQRRSVERLVFGVVDVLKGPSTRTLRLVPNGVFPHGAAGRFIILIDGKWLHYAFKVTSAGRVTSVWTGATRPHHYPRTLAGWYRKLGLAVPDTATLSPAQPAKDAPQPAAPVVLLVGACPWP